MSETIQALIVFTDVKHVSRINSMFHVHQNHGAIHLSERLGDTEWATYTAMDGKAYEYNYIEHSFSVYDLHEFKKAVNRGDFPGFKVYVPDYVKDTSVNYYDL